jgi:hypothetical protein
MTSKIQIGLEFFKLIKPTKVKKTWFLRKYIIHDFYITKNSKNEIVKTQWVVYSLCLNQKVFDFEIPTNTILRALIDNENENLTEKFRIN